MPKREKSVWMAKNVKAELMAHIMYNLISSSMGIWQEISKRQETHEFLPEFGQISCLACLEFKFPAWKYN